MSLPIEPKVYGIPKESKPDGRTEWRYLYGQDFVDLYPNPNRLAIPLNIKLPYRKLYLGIPNHFYAIFGGEGWIRFYREREIICELQAIGNSPSYENRVIAAAVGPWDAPGMLASSVDSMFFISQWGIDSQTYYQTTTMSPLRLYVEADSVEYSLALSSYVDPMFTTTRVNVFKIGCMFGVLSSEKSF